MQLNTSLLVRECNCIHMGRATITVSSDTFQDLSDAKPDDMTWDTFLAMSVGESVPMGWFIDGSDDTPCIDNEDVIRRIDELGERLPERVADELEARLR